MADERVALLHVSARDVRNRAHAPYSKFKVGAAVLDNLGQVHVGCNVENASYPEGVCAETNALGAMVAGGGTACQLVVICAGDDQIITPCGGCRQRLAEFCTPETPVISFTAKGDQRFETTLGDLLPRGFSASDFK